MLSRWKVAVVTGLFVLSALSFFLGLFPSFADVFWVLWFVGCGACILALVLTVVVPTHRRASDSVVAGARASNHSVADAPASNRPAADSADGVSQP